METFESTPGARGGVTIGGRTTNGWMLFDTGTTHTKVRGEAGTATAQVELALGDLTLTPKVGYDPFAGIRAPDGGQLALLGTDLLKDLAVRIDGAEQRIWLSEPGHGCSADVLRAAGFVRMDSNGYFHDDVDAAPWQSVGNYLAPNVPTVEMEILGQRVRAQIDTGYAGGGRQIQINAKMRALVAERLGEQVDTVSFGAARYPRFRPKDARVGLVVEEADGARNVVEIAGIEILEKNDGESIAAWDVPAAMVSAAILDAAFSVVEFRADQASVWGRVRAGAAADDAGNNKTTSCSGKAIDDYVACGTHADGISEPTLENLESWLKARHGFAPKAVELEATFAAANARLATVREISVAKKSEPDDTETKKVRTAKAELEKFQLADRQIASAADRLAWVLKESEKHEGLSKLTSEVVKTTGLAITDPTHARLVAASGRATASLAVRCSVDSVDDVARSLECAILVDKLDAALRSWEVAALSAQTYGVSGAPMEGPQQVYHQARSAREAVTRSLDEARQAVREARSKCRMKRLCEADSVSSCGDPKQIERILGPQRQGFDAAGMRAAADLNKSTGGGAMTSTVADVLDATARVALKRAKRQALGLVHDRLEHDVCRLTWRPNPEGEAEPLLPATCDLIANTSLETLLGDPRRLQPALVSDLGALATTIVIERADLGDLESLKPVLRTALAIATRVRSQQLPLPSHKDAVALLNSLLRVVRDAQTTGQWSKHPEVPLALEALAVLVEQGGKNDVATIVDSLAENLDFVDAETRTTATRLALLGLRGLGLSRDPTPGDEHDAWVAAVDLVLTVSMSALQPESDSKKQRVDADDLEDLRDLALAIADENVPAALTAAGELAARHAASVFEEQRAAQRNAPPLCDPGDRKCERNAKAALRVEHQLGRRTAAIMRLLSGASTYAATYSAALQQGKSEAELRAARAEALEAMIDLVTRRENREGRWVFSLGIPVGFATGVQWTRRFGRAVDADDGSQQCDVERDRDDADCRFGFDGKKGRPMPPQLELPLGFAAQRLPGKRFRDGHATWRHGGSESEEAGHNRWYFDGIHTHVSLLDLGQFIAYDADGKVNQPRWDTIFSPGVQLGWAFGRPANMLVVAGTFRYAPTLFAGTSSIHLQDSDRPGGALRLGISLAYYVSILDLN